MIPITKVDVSDSEELVLEVLRSGNLAQGPMVKRLEDIFAEAHQVNHCVAVNNGTTALVAALQVCDLKPGQEVVTSPFTFVATLNAILEAGAIARFVDISYDDYCLSPTAVLSGMNEKTAVLMPVHLYGQSADMGSISEIADDNGLFIVEDAAQAHGSKFKNNFVGSYGLGCFSLYATKNITSADGVLITTNDSGLAERLRILRNQGMKARYEYVMAGHNYRLTDVHAAIAIPQIEKIPEIIARRNDNAMYLSEQLSNLQTLKVPSVMSGRTHVWHQYTILIERDAGIDRDQFISRMTELGIGCGSYYPKLTFEYDCFKNNPNIVVDDVTVARDVASRCVSLPVHQYLTHDDLDRIIGACFDALQN
jgi:dTDP-4-amino-4,6-dideoxygalactose transaminase